MKRLIGILIMLPLICNYACSKNSIEKENKKRKNILLEKLDRGQKLTGIDISNLSGILLTEENYAEGIDILERLKKLDNYKEERFKIYFVLSLFYAEKSKRVQNREKQITIENAKSYMIAGFNETPEKALAYYKRAKVYVTMGCIEEAKMDFQKALDSAKSKNIIYFDDGIYLNRENFKEVVNNDLAEIKLFKEACILKAK